jgi:molecular chaperone DnaJ
LETYYETLGVQENATQDEIKKAFRSKSKEYHPDKGGDEDMFKKINEAYSVLSDTQKKNQYDNRNNNPFSQFGFDMGGGNPFEDLFNMFGGRQQQRRAPDRVMEINVGAVDSFLGKKIEVNFTRKINCDPCGGQGGERQTCNTCGGSGRIMQRVGNHFMQNIIQTTCGSCGGKGFHLKTTCNHCSGEGRIDEKQMVGMNLPVGVSDGQLVRAQSMGDYSNGMFGDLIFKINLVQQDGFEKVGGDLVFNNFLSINDLNAEEISIPHPHGELKIKMPITVDTSVPLKVKGKGYPNEYGDLYVKLYVKHTRL